MKQPGQGEDALPNGQANGETLLEDALVELARSLKAVHFYPRGHPTLQTNLDKTYKCLNEAIGEQEQLALGVSKDGFVFSSNPFAPSNQTIRGLAREFFLRQIVTVFFIKDVSIQDIENFLRIMAMEEELFRGKGKAEEYLTDSGITHIWANEIKLGQSRPMPGREKAPTEATPIDDRLVQLIESLRTETDPRKYLALAREASITAQRFIDEQKFDQAFVIMRIFREAFTKEPLRATMIVEAARTGYMEISGSEMIEYILRQLTLLDGPRKDEIFEVASGLGDKLIQAILDKLATNEALYSHRALIQVLLSAAETSREQVEARLEDDRWWVTRKMAFLLGEMGDETSTPALMKISSHSDVKVRKEVFKALSKIGAPEATRKLIDIIVSKEPMEIRIHSIRLLGTARERSAVPTLVKILKTRGALLDNIELLEEAIKALGKIGSTQAVGMLAELLNKRSMLAKAKSINLGVEAAEALGAIGGKDAMEALQKGSENKQQEIKLASTRALKSFQQTVDSETGENQPKA